MVAEGATLVLVIGSQTSSNAVRLVEVAQAAGAEATLIDGESRLDDGADRRARDDRPHRRRVDARAARAGGRARALRARLSDARGDHGRARARPLPAAEGGRARMTSIEVPYSIAAALPTLSVMDITNEVREVGRALRAARTASRTSPRRARCRSSASRSARPASSRISSACSSASCRATRRARERLVHALLGSRTEQVPFSEGCLCLGQWQRDHALLARRRASATTGRLTLLG